MNDKFVTFMRENRVVSVLLSVFVMYWAYDAYLFVNANHTEIKEYILIFYVSIVGLAGWVTKHWMTTNHNSSKTDE